jgi:hypothetical protein
MTPTSLDRNRKGWAGFLFMQVIGLVFSICITGLDRRILYTIIVSIINNGHLRKILGIYENITRIA